MLISPLATKKKNLRLQSFLSWSHSEMCCDNTTLRRIRKIWWSSNSECSLPPVYLLMCETLQILHSPINGNSQSSWWLTSDACITVCAERMMRDFNNHGRSYSFLPLRRKKSAIATSHLSYLDLWPYLWGEESENLIIVKLQCSLRCVSSCGRNPEILHLPFLMRNLNPADQEKCDCKDPPEGSVIIPLPRWIGKFDDR